MQQHILQSEHNQKFHLSICSHNPNNFFDWKITCLFYDAIHCLKALAAKKGVNIGHTHSDIERNVSPFKNATIMPLPHAAWNNYHNLYRYSRSSRYNGFTSETAFEIIKQIDHNHCLQCIENFKSYVKSQGVPLP